MKTLSLIILISFLLPPALWSQSKTEQLLVPLSKPGKPFKLALALGNGTISVNAYEGKEIMIVTEPVVEKTDKNESNQNTNTNVNINPNINIHSGRNPEINLVSGKYFFGEENNNNIFLHASYPNKVFNVVIKIPRNSPLLSFYISGKGDISITDIAGEIEAMANNGSIVLKDISGSAVASTITGTINASFKTIIPKPMAFSTLVGNIDLTLPSQYTANVKLKSDNGNIYTDFVIEPDEKPHGPDPRPIANPDAAAKTKYRLMNDDWVQGLINRGGAPLMMKNTDGNIYIRAAN
jgi:hypothetical protein